MSCSVGLLFRPRVDSSALVSDKSKVEEGASGFAWSMELFRLLDWKLRSVEVLVGLVSDDKAIPGNKVRRCWREKLGLK